MSPDSLLNTATDTVSALGASTLAVAAGGLLLGFLFWGLGRRILRPSMVLLGNLIGAMTGYLLTLGLDLPVPGWAGALAGAAVFGIAAWLAFRPVMGLSLAILFAAAGPMSVLAWAEIRGIEILPAAEAGEADSEVESDDEALPFLEHFRRGFALLQESEEVMAEWRRFEDRLRSRSTVENPSDDPPAGPDEADDDLADDPDSLVDEAAEDDGGAPEDEGEAATPTTGEWLDQIEAGINGMWSDLKSRWDAATPGVRKSLLLSTVCGASLGLLIGLLAPAVAAAVLTAMGGSIVILFSGWTLGTELGFANAAWIPHSTMMWLLVWMALSVTGLGIQWTMRPEPADKNEGSKSRRKSKSKQGSKSK